MPEGHRFHPSVLREYDIRGIVGKTLSEADAFAVGRAFATVVRKTGGKKIAVGYDGRLSSPGFARAARKGIVAAGVDAVDVGRGPTPMLYYSVKKLRVAAGLMITGSHNPADYNGFKMMTYDGPFYGKAILKLGAIAAKGAFATGEGEMSSFDVFPHYVDRLVTTLGKAPGLKGMRIAWDAGNGAAGEAMASLVRRIPGKHVLLNHRIDGRFPNHHPDPTVAENLEQLIDTVKRRRCHAGIAFDGDGDRIGTVDGQGRILWADQLMVILARPLINPHIAPAIIADVKASQVLFDEIARMGGRPIMWKTGHSLIKAKMIEVDSPFSGEMSGHIFYKSQYGFDDALYVAVQLLRILARSDKTLAEMRDALPQKVNTPEIRFTCSEERKFAAVEEVKARLKKAKAKVATVDGVRVLTDDGWWLLRASNTQDVLVARCESDDEAGLARLKSAVAEQLRLSQIDAPDF